MGRHAALLHIDYVDQRLPLLRDLIALAERNGRLDLAAHGHQWSTHALLELGALDQARVEQRAFTRIAEELREPGYTSGLMPNFGQTLSPKQISDLVAYLTKG